VQREARAGERGGPRSRVAAVARRHPLRPQRRSKGDGGKQGGDDGDEKSAQQGEAALVAQGGAALVTQGGAALVTQGEAALVTGDGERGRAAIVLLRAYGSAPGSAAHGSSSCTVTSPRGVVHVTTTRRVRSRASRPRTPSTGSSPAPAASK